MPNNIPRLVKVVIPKHFSYVYTILLITKSFAIRNGIQIVKPSTIRNCYKYDNAYSLLSPCLRNKSSSSDYRKASYLWPPHRG